MRVRTVYTPIFGNPRADGGGAGFSMKTRHRSACKMVYRRCFPAYVA